MNVLFPRLLRGEAGSLYDAYKGLTVPELCEHVRLNHEGAVFVATGGARVSAGQLFDLRSAILQIAAESGFPNQASTARYTQFDLGVARFLHSSSGLIPAEAASGDIWAFIALVLMPDVSYWRFPEAPKDRVLASDITRHVFGRLWWRAHLTRDPDAEDQYADLALLNESEIDQIYARRTSLGASSFVVRAILKVWSAKGPESLRRDTLRDFLKRLLRLAAFTRFDAQSEDELATTLSGALEASIRSIEMASRSGRLTREDRSSG